MANDIEAVRAAFLAWIRDDGYLVPSAVTDIEWDDEGLPVYYTRDDGERHYLDGEWHAWQAATSRAALAVAPATATDRLAGMPPHFHFGGEAIAALESAGMGRNGKPNCLIDMILEACNALRAAPPATGDAAAVREALQGWARFCMKWPAKECDDGSGYYSEADHDQAVCYAATTRALALPLPAPAPATAVEEARQNFTVCALAFMQSPDRDAMGAIRLMHEAYRRYVAAEAAATHAAKESRSDGHATPTQPAPFRDIWQHDETGRIVELPLGAESPGRRYQLVATTNAGIKPMTTPAPADVGDDDPACTCAPLGKATCVKHAPADDAGADDRMFDFETMRTIAVGAARRARDLPYATPERCADLVLADLGIDRNPGPAVRMEFESQIVFCRVCGMPPQQHPFGNCADLRIGGEPR